MARRYIAAGGRHIDTARIYSGGDCEPIVGRALATCAAESPSAAIALGSKAHPSQPAGLSSAGIDAQLRASLTALGTSSLSEFYLHQPDTEHALLESLQAAHRMVVDGTAAAIGM